MTPAYSPRKDLEVHNKGPIAGPTLSSKERAAMMERALCGAGISLLHQNANLQICHSENLPSHLKDQLVLGENDTSLFGSKDGQRVMEAKRAVLATGDPAQIEVECSTVDGQRTYEIKIERTEESGSHGILSILIEVTDIRHRERALKMLLRELSHRSKNLLAIIQGIATQTARFTPSLDYFLTKFRGRLQSLSNSQDLVTDSSWRGAYLFDLAQRQFAPYWPEGGRPIAIRGVNAHFNPNAAVHLGLALHELIVNSASYGALSKGSTAISIECVPTTLGERGAVEIVWTEHLTRNSDDPEFYERHFGRTVLERVVPISMNGRSNFSISPEMIEYRLTVPDTEYDFHK